jgi:hypothetical protein
LLARERSIVENKQPPAEPFRYFNFGASVQAPIGMRNPRNQIAFGIVLILVGLIAPVVRQVTANWIAGAFFLMLGGLMTYVGVRRRTWARAYERIHGVAPWVARDRAEMQAYRQQVFDSFEQSPDLTPEMKSKLEELRHSLEQREPDSGGTPVDQPPA